MVWLQCGSSMVAMRAADAEACQMGQTLSRNYTRWNFRSNTQAHANANALLLKHTNTNKQMNTAESHEQAQGSVDLGIPPAPSSIDSSSILALPANSRSCPGILTKAGTST